MNGKVLLVEDDYALAMGTEFSLQSEGFDVILAKTISDAKKADLSKINIILLDVMLPDGNGYEYCKWIRERNSNIPIIFLTAVSEEANIVQGLEVGGDDYVTKPYRVKELVSRIRANLRRNNLENNKYNLITFGKCVLDIDNYSIKSNGIIIECTLSEFKLLKELAINKGNILTRNQLMEKLWDVDEAFVDDNTLSVYIKRLRDKLGEDASYIKTVRGVGYCFWDKEEK